jgi:hypothetical protein
VTALRKWVVVPPSGYTEAEEFAEQLGIVEGCLLFLIGDEVTAAYSPAMWRTALQQPPPKPSEPIAVGRCPHGRRWDEGCGPCGDQP